MIKLLLLRLNQYFKDAGKSPLLTVEQIHGLLTNQDLPTHALDRHGPLANLTQHPAFNRYIGSIPFNLADLVPSFSYRSTCKCNGVQNITAWNTYIPNSSDNRIARLRRHIVKNVLKNKETFIVVLQIWIPGNCYC